MFDLRFFEIYRNGEYMWRLAEGVWLSISLTVTAAIIGFIAAALIAVARMNRVPVLSQIAVSYVEFIRNTPLIV